MIAAAGTGAGRGERLGVILLHGKLGDPLERRAGLDALASCWSATASAPTWRSPTRCRAAPSPGW
jgi:hypothetical protein